MKAMLLAAGYGTRLRPLTWTVPKPLIPVCNRPLIAYAIDSLLAEGAGELIVNLHHLPDELERAVRSEFSGRATLHFSFEPEILGTGGGVRNVRHLLEDEEDFFLLNGDTIQQAALARLRDERRRSDSIAALTLRHAPDNDRFTPVFAEEGRVTGFGSGRGEALMFSGSHCISSRIFRHLPDKPFSGIIDEAYQPLLDGGRETIAAVVDDGVWFDIGTPQRYLSASRALIGLMASGAMDVPRGSRVEGTNVVHETARVAGEAGGSTIGAGSAVAGSVRDSIVWDGCSIAAETVLESCIVASGVRIDRPLHLRDSILCRDDSRIPREGLVVEDGLVIARFR